MECGEQACTMVASSRCCVCVRRGPSCELLCIASVELGTISTQHSTCGLRRKQTKRARSASRAQAKKRVRSASHASTILLNEWAHLRRKQRSALSDAKFLRYIMPSTILFNEVPHLRRAPEALHTHQPFYLTNGLICVGSNGAH